jgi:hypothetical protein
VDLREADLHEANLCDTKLEAADFRGACLEGTNFSGAKLKGTTFVDVDLSKAQGLDEALHHGPSLIGVDTLYRLRGKVSDKFLRGCGVPENLIKCLPSLTNQPSEFYSCFISYSHADKSFARRLHDALQGRGIRCWLDEHQMLPGDDIYEQVDRGIRLWDKVLLCASEHSLRDSWWVDGEINRAFQKEARIMKERGKKVGALIPLNLDGYLFQWESGKATEVTSRLAADFTGWESDNAKFEREFEKVVKALQTGDVERELPPPSLL